MLPLPQKKKEKNLMSDKNASDNYKSFAFKRLIWSLIITVVVMVVEIVGGYISGSIALYSDAGHMLTHAFAIGVSLFGILIARRPACHHRTFGLLRAEILAALFNALFLFAVTGIIVYESIKRLIHPRDILTFQMFGIALIGLVVNIISIALLESSRHGDLNIKGVFLHMIGDAASSVAIVITAVVIYFTDWVWLDPVVSMGIAVLILVWAWNLTKDSLRVLLEMAPKDKTAEDITSGLKEKFPRIEEITREHVWTITPEIIIFTAHLRIRGVGIENTDDFVFRVEKWLAEEFDIYESTLQIWREDSIPKESTSLWEKLRERK